MRLSLARPWISIGMAIVLALGLPAQQANVCQQQSGPINQSGIAYAMYFDSKFRDAAQCAMHVEHGKLVIDSHVTNPAVSCPDMYAWKLFVDSLQGRFWANWAADQQTWPGCSAGSPGCTGEHKPTMPLPLCAGASSGANCCDPKSMKNPGYDDNWNPAKYCPYFPGDHLGATESARAPIGNAPVKAHIASFAHMAKMSLQQLQSNDPSRVIRQTMSEIVYRNKPFFEYVFENNLYNQEGLAAVFNQANAGLSGNPPYRLASAPGKLAEIEFPVEAVMIKSDWLNEKTALQMGLRDEPEHIKMEILSPVTDNNGTVLEKGVHWLVAMHISSKDTPNWVWATFEHVANPGRCDYTGCNDSYGYASPDKAIAANQRKNFTMPHVTCDNLPLASYIFDTEKQYAGGPIEPALATVFKQSGIATGTKAMPPSPGDPRWLNYRLKGTQIDFHDSMGNPTRLGNSVTEAGFINTSSCITCHSRASVNAKGSIPLPNGVFMNTLGEQGYAQSAMGTPNPAWFQASANPPSYRALQADFVWGVLTALCIDTKFNPGVCQLSTSSNAAETLKATPEKPVHNIRDLVKR